MNVGSLSRDPCFRETVDCAAQRRPGAAIAAALGLDQPNCTQQLHNVFTSKIPYPDLRAGRRLSQRLPFSCVCLRSLFSTFVSFGVPTADWRTCEGYGRSEKRSGGDGNCCCGTT